MKKLYYVLCHDGEPEYIYSTIDPIRESCHDWFDKHRITKERDFYFWVEDRKYANTKDGELQAWNDYIDWNFENGCWNGDYGEGYSWFEEYLD